MIRLMQIIAEHDCTTQTGAKLMAGSKNTGIRYINTLKKMFLVDTIDTMLNPGKAYCLTTEGYKFLESRNLLRVRGRFYRSDYKPTQYAHTTTGVKVRLTFERHPWVKDYRTQKVVAWYLNQMPPEQRVLRGKQCDAEVFISSPQAKRHAGIEIELTRKSQSAYVRNILGIDTYRKDLSGVFWLCSTQEIIDTIREVIQRLLPQLRQHQEHYFIQVDKFIERAFEADWTAADGQPASILPWPVPAQENTVTEAAKTQWD